MFTLFVNFGVCIFVVICLLVCTDLDCVAFVVLT